MTRAQRKARNAKIVALHLRGVKHISIGAEFNIDASSVGRILRQNGIPKASSWITQRLRLKAQEASHDRN